MSPLSVVFAVNESCPSVSDTGDPDALNVKSLLNVALAAWKLMLWIPLLLYVCRARVCYGRRRHGAQGQGSGVKPLSSLRTIRMSLVSLMLAWIFRHLEAHHVLCNQDRGTHRFDSAR